MKLYEFTYTDNQNLSETALLERVADFLENESILQGWAPGYKFQLCQKVEQLPGGERNFFFDVLGSYLDSDSLSFDEESPDQAEPVGRAAAREADL